MFKGMTQVYLHLFPVHDTHELQLALSNLNHFLDEPGTNRALELGDSEAWSVTMETLRSRIGTYWSAVS